MNPVSHIMGWNDFWRSIIRAAVVKQKRFERIAWIWLDHLHLQWKFKLFKLLGKKFIWGNTAKQLGDVIKLFVSKSLLIMPSNVLPLHLKQTFPPIIWIFTEGEGDGIESRLPFKIFSTLKEVRNYRKFLKILLSTYKEIRRKQTFQNTK